MTQNQIDASTAAYIRTQIQRLESGRYPTDDCLWRIASAANLLPPLVQEVNDSNRARIEAWVQQFKAWLTDKSCLKAAEPPVVR
ncbi:hypothetical protein [Thermoleptolyngbya sp.]